ncbi:MAG: gfo/Idh/MocA family oxidoreductase [Candidatus Dadabacteria bacterium]|nr:MAG: gfo/Idh/MocA family oxidoreductase [Candidatus Dadabacteria bacterium]
MGGRPEASELLLRVGIVGCGTIANTHVPYIRQAGGHLVAVADASVVQANDLADRYGIQRAYCSVSDLVEAEHPDVIHVLTPPHTHAEVAIPALERGIHVLVEKPMAVDPAEARAMRNAAVRGGALLCVDHNRLFDPVVLRARQMVEDGRLGDVVAVESYQAGSASERPWLGRLPGGGLGDLLPHPLYLLLHFLGDVEELHAMVLAGAGQKEPEELRVLMRAGACSGALTISSRARPGINTLRICGTRMTLEVDLNNMTLVQRRDFQVPKPLAKVLPAVDAARQLLLQTAGNAVAFAAGRVRYYPGMGILIRRFYGAIRERKEPPVAPEEGVRVVEITKRIWESASLAGATEVASLRGEVAR